MLVDSELIDARIRRRCFQAEGIAVTAEDLQNHPGISGTGLAEIIQERFGRPMRDGFMQATRAKIMRVFTDELPELLGSIRMLVCVASNSHTDRLRHSLEVTGLLRFSARMCSVRSWWKRIGSRSLSFCRRETRHCAR